MYLSLGNWLRLGSYSGASVASVLWHCYCPPQKKGLRSYNVTVLQHSRVKTLHLVSVMWTQTTTLSQKRPVLQEHMCKQYFRTVILYVMFLFFWGLFLPEEKTANKYWILFLLEQESTLETLPMIIRIVFFLLLTLISGYLNLSKENGILISFYPPL